MGTDPQTTPIQASDGVLYGTTNQGSRNKSGVIYRVNPDGSGYRVLYHFGPLPPPGPSSGNVLVNSPGRLLEARDGRLYGVAQNGAPYGGAIFRLEKSGAGFSIIRQYPTSGSQPARPVAGLIQGTDGLLYGSTTDSGAGAPTTIFRMNLDGGSYQVIYTMGRLATSPRGILNPLFEGRDGLLYGTSRTGGANSSGAVFKLGKTGTAFQLLHSFSSTGGGGYSPWGGVIEGSDGVLYGTVELGGSKGRGGIYRLGRDGTGFGMVCELGNPEDGELRTAKGEPVESPDGYLYGVASESYRNNFFSPNASGGLFRVRKDATGFETLARFASMGQETETPVTGMVLTKSGAWLGVANTWGSNAFRPGFLYGLSAADRSFSILRLFSESGSDPNLPYSLLEGSDGRFYGATNQTDFDDDFFSLQRDGRETRVLYQYKGDTRPDKPAAGELFEGADGRFYASSFSGGPGGRGSMTRIDPTGANFTRLFSLNSAPATSPKAPFGGVIQGSDGFFYGTTSQGGQFERGTVFRVAADGTGLTVIHDFAQNTGHFSSNSPLMQLLEGSKGALHGMTRFGCYRLNKDGTGYLYTDFPRTGVEPVLPRGPLIEASDGILYGTTTEGGTARLGTIFKINQDGSGFTVLHQCTVANGAPYRPTGSLAEGQDGKIYGVSTNGGANSDNGALFSINRDGSGFVRLRSFGATGDGINPVTLVRSGDGLFYGVTQRGGAYNYGTFFRYGEAPEISVEQPAGRDLASGAALVEFGGVRLGTPQSLDLVIKNSGELPLGPVSARMAGPQAADFAAAALVPDTIAPGASGVMRITFSPGAIGMRSATLFLESNDFDESPFVIALSGTGLAPDIAVYDGPTTAGQELTDGQTVPLNFGVVRVVGQAERRLTIANTGNVPLIITSISAPGGFSVQALPPLPVSIAPNGTLVLEVRFEARVPGVFTGMVGIASDDPDEATFDIPVTGEAVSPEIAVYQGPDNGAPELISGQAGAVDFGRVVQGTIGGNSARGFTITNTGTAPLAVSAITVPPGFELRLSSLPILAPGASASWEIRLTSMLPGPHSGQVVITSDDLDEPQFSFPVTGVIFIPEPSAAPPSAVTVLNRQTGFREQIIRLANNTTATVPAYRLLISGLPAGVTLPGAAEVRADGTVVVLVRQPLTPFSTFDLVLEYASSNRQPVEIKPVIATEVVLDPSSDRAGAAAGTFGIERIVRLPDGEGVLLEFGSAPDKLYSVEYSDNGAAWKTSDVPVRGSGNRTQWIDRGPPRTGSPPATQSVRFYRVRALPE